MPATNDNVQKEDYWAFWIVPTPQLDAELGPQKGLGVSTLDSLTTRLDHSDPSLAGHEVWWVVIGVLTWGFVV